MGKRRKRKWWWEGTDYDESPSNSEVDSNLFGNTISQHNKKMGVYNGGNYSYDYDDSYVESPFQFDWGLQKNLTDIPKDGAKAYQSARDTFGTYQKGGAWQGYEYYKKPELSYKYVQQMANALAAQYKITVKVGSSWAVDLKAKTLTYNPTSLIYGTKSELLATLMHEIGKLRYGTHPDELTDKYLATYGMPAVETLSIFEDVRVDYMMLKAYEGAGEIYESAIPAVDKKIKEYREMSVIFRKVIADYLSQNYNNVLRKTQADSNSEDDFKIKFEENLHTVFGERDQALVSQRIQDIQAEYVTNGSIYDYNAEMLRIMYDTDSPETGFQNIKDRITSTEPSIAKVKKFETSQKTVDHLSESVYPVIEDLLRDFNRDNEKIKNAFPNMPQVVRDNFQQQIQNEFSHMQKKGRVNTDPDGNSSIRTSGPTDDIIPKEWTTGDYAPIRESVMPDIKSLIKKLTFIRREDMTKKFQSEQRRGKLNMKSLYKSATGNRRVFKKLLPNSNTVQSFAFSIIVDTSGSMSGRNMVHTTRALTIFSEVFKKMDIPFEVITFSSGAKTLKKFDEQVDKEMEQRIGGMVNAACGGTNLDQGLLKMRLEHQPHKNKVCVVLTDGGVGDMNHFDETYFKPMAKKGILSVGFGIACEKAMAKLCMGNSKVLDNPSELPMEFTNLLKSLIKGK